MLGIPREDGRSDLELYSAAGRNEKTLSGGDSRDTNPSFGRKRPNTVLYQSSGHQAPPGVRRRDLVIEAVQLARGGRFLFDVQRVGGG